MLFKLKAGDEGAAGGNGDCRQEEALLVPLGSGSGILTRGREDEGLKPGREGKESRISVSLGVEGVKDLSEPGRVRSKESQCAGQVSFV